ncbi:gamma carbonic anhydrase 1, mitochondrial-like protein [Tanacetum coccineum]
MDRMISPIPDPCLQLRPNMVILGEEVVASKLTIFDITKQICDAVQARAEKGDVNNISIGSGTNIQDHSLVHVAKSNLPGKVHPTMIGDNFDCL